jgi:PEP-CTERM motif
MHARFRLRFLSALLSLAALALPAAAQVLDSFSDGASLLEVPLMTPGADGWLRSDTAASVPGGSRSLALRNTPDSTALAWIQARGSDGLQAYRLPTQTLLVSFGYGQLAPMNLDLSGQSALALDMRWGGVQPPAGPWNADGLTVTVYANTSNGAGLDPDGSSMSAVLRGVSVVVLPFAAFTLNASTGRPVNWADVDSLLFVVTENAVGGSAAGFGLRSVSAVPEPGTWALAALGLAVLARRAACRRPVVV